MVCGEGDGEQLVGSDGDETSWSKDCEGEETHQDEVLGSYYDEAD
jgi:hypothetical protein